MAIRKYKPTTPGRRGSSVADFAEITRSTPEKSLLRPLSKTGGRNNQGRITTRHIGGGHKRQYRVIDFRRNDKDGVPAKVAHIEYDPNRTARIALLQLVRREDVALGAVHEVQQRDARGAVRVVLDVRDLGRHAVLLRAPEVDHPVGALVPAALVPCGHPAVHVPAALGVQRTDQRLLRRAPGDLGEVGDRGAAATRGRRLVLTDTHWFFSSLPLLRRR